MPNMVWDEAKHPRHPKGSERGGEFAPKLREAGEVEINTHTGAFYEFPSQVTRKAWSTPAAALWDEFTRAADAGYLATLALLPSAAASAPVFVSEFDSTDPLLDDALDEDETGLVGLEDAWEIATAFNSVDALATKATGVAAAKRAVEALAEELEAVIARYQAGRLRRAAARQEFLDTLRAKYRKAFARVRGADKYDIPNKLVAEQSRFVDGFLDAVDEGLEQDKALRRARLYAESLRGARAQAQILKLPNTTRLEWVWNPQVEQHCDSCAALNGKIKTVKRWNALRLFPGCAVNACGQFCKCRWKRMPDPPMWGLGLVGLRLPRAR